MILLSILFSFAPVMIGAGLYAYGMSMDDVIWMSGLIALTVWPIFTLMAIFVSYEFGTHDWKA